MKNKLLCLLFVLCLSPIITNAAVTKTLQVEFAFSESGNLQQTLGYRLYKENTQVCQTSDPSASTISCSLTTEPGTFNFSLTAYFANGSESPSSPSFPFTISSATSTPPTAVLSSSTSAGKAPLVVNFDGSSSTTSNPPIVKYTWDFGDGSQATGKTASHSFTTAGTYYTSLTIKDSNSLTNSINTPVIVTSTSQPNPDPLPTSAFNIEVGEVSINQTWVKVLFENTFSHPIVVAGPPTSNENEPVLMRIRNIDQKGFEIRLQEWAYQNGNHAAETFSYIVMEKGTFTLNNGTKVEAGTFTGSNKFQKISLLQSYNSTPVILSQVLTQNATDAVTGRIRTAGQTSFDYMLQEQELNSTSHTSETVGYIAWEPGQGEFANMVYKAGNTTNSIGDAWKEITFESTFPDLPFFIAGMQTTDGGDTAAVRTQNMSQTKTQIKIEEEKSKDAEVGHTSEVVGYLAISNKTTGTTPTDDVTSTQPWNLKYVDSEELVGENGAAINAIDGDPSTFWHTAWSTSTTSYPHEIQINLGAIQAINGIHYLPRQDGGVNGTIAKYAVYVSNDGVNWGNAVAQGTFAKDTTKKEVLFPATNGQFLRLVALSEINGNQWTSMAELNILYTTPTDNGTSAIPWSLNYVDSEETARQNGSAINAFDDDPTTIWHTAWSTSTTSCPHEIQINLGAIQTINGISYLPRQDGGVNGTIAKYAVYVSNDGMNWGSAVAQGTFTKNTTKKEVLFPATSGKFLRLVALSEINGKAWTSIAELNVISK